MTDADFSGWATKHNMKCSDGRTIMPDAFAHQDKMRVPLVWQHQHDQPVNILGYAELENKPQGVYARGFFNDSSSADHAKELVKHGDIKNLSIYANQLSERNKNVMHGNITEVSLVLAGANPGAYIDNVNLVHGDQVDVLVDEAVIYTDEELSHSADSDEDSTVEPPEVDPSEDEDLDIPEVFETLDDDQKAAVHYMLSEALSHADTTKGSTAVATDTKEKSVAEVFDTLSDEQKNVVYYMISEALSGDGSGTSTASHGDETEALVHSDLNKDELVGEITGAIIKHMEDSGMGHTVFDQSTDEKKPGTFLTHSQLETIIGDAQKNGSLKESFLAHAVEYGVEDIDILFPDARAAANAPDVISRRMEWVENVINGTKHSPFSRVKSTAVDLTADEARAKGYVKGNLKKDEIIKLLKRVTTPTTVYKKQKLDRDDIVDITDLDVVAWLKAEMRVMLDEELARAILIGDGRESDDEDKIDEDHIRPIAYDADMYATSITIGNALSADAIVEQFMRSRSSYKGTGTPTLYTTDSLLTDLLLAKDKFGRRIYETVADLAAVIRVADIIPVEVLEDAQDILGIVVNLTDYTLGADNGGQVSMFDDFDIDYNQFKYLIETRVSGALTKPKSAIVFKRVVGTSVTPTAPSYNGTTHVITFPTVTGVDYQVNGVTKTGTLTITETTDVESVPQAGYSFPHNVNRDWTYSY